MQSHGRNKPGGATMVSAKDSFLAAVNWFLRKKGHGAQAELSEAVGFLRSY